MPTEKAVNQLTAFSVYGLNQQGDEKRMESAIVRGYADTGIPRPHKKNNNRTKNSR
jgi:hypothetical protein